MSRTIGMIGGPSKTMSTIKEFINKGTSSEIPVIELEKTNPLSEKGIVRTIRGVNYGKEK